MTFSIVARCEQSGMFGVAVTSSSPAVAARCAYARARAGAVASQNITDPTLGTRGLDLLENGSTAQEVITSLCGSGRHIEYRQILAVDGQGGTAVYSGPNALGLNAHAMDRNAASGGNLLSSQDVPGRIVDAFVGANGHIGERLLLAMEAGVKAGGEAGPIHSAGMKLVREVPWPVADLRVDWTELCPIAELRRLWDIYAPQLEDYVTRALDPASAPSYGVPGDE